MFEKVNPCHPDKVADRIAGAIVDLCYKSFENPKVAVEVLLGHGYCYIIVESSVTLTHQDVEPIVNRITGVAMTTRLISIPQDPNLAANQNGAIRCGDNGIFRGEPVSSEEQMLTNIVGKLFKKYPTDGKFIINDDKIIACQSCAKGDDVTFGIKVASQKYVNVFTNPLGDWTGGTDVDSGATNRKLGSDMGRGVTGGGLHGKDLSKADVSVNIACHLLAQTFQCSVSACCAIGDDAITFNFDKDLQSDSKPYSKVVQMAREYIDKIGGFEKFAEWGLIRPEA